MHVGNQHSYFLSNFNDSKVTLGSQPILSNRVIARNGDYSIDGPDFLGTNHARDICDKGTMALHLMKTCYLL